MHVPQKVNPTTLQCRDGENSARRSAQAAVFVGDDQLHGGAKRPLGEIAKQRQPKGLDLGGARDIAPKIRTI